MSGIVSCESARRGASIGGMQTNNEHEETAPRFSVVTHTPPGPGLRQTRPLPALAAAVAVAVDPRGTTQCR